MKKKVNLERRKKKVNIHTTSLHLSQLILRGLLGRRVPPRGGQPPLDPQPRVEQPLLFVHSLEAEDVAVADLAEVAARRDRTPVFVVVVDAEGGLNSLRSLRIAKAHRNQIFFFQTAY